MFSLSLWWSCAEMVEDGFETLESRFVGTPFLTTLQSFHVVTGYCGNSVGYTWELRKLCACVLICPLLPGLSCFSLTHRNGCCDDQTQKFVNLQAQIDLKRQDGDAEENVVLVVAVDSGSHGMWAWRHSVARWTSGTTCRWYCNKGRTEGTNYTSRFSRSRRKQRHSIHKENNSADYGGAP